MKTDPPVKSTYKESIKTKINAFHEKYLREDASSNSLMQYFNVSVTGLRGRRHPALSNIMTTIEVQKSRIHRKMLAGNYFTYELRSARSGGSPHCRCCSLTSENENLQHILTNCSQYSDIRNRIIEEYKTICEYSASEFPFDEILSKNGTFCQFILDPASLNLKYRISMSDPILEDLFKVSCDFCHAVNSRRMKTLKIMMENSTQILV